MLLNNILLVEYYNTTMCYLLQECFLLCRLLILSSIFYRKFILVIAFINMAENDKIQTIPETALKNSWSWWYSPRGRNSKPNAQDQYETNLTKLGDCETLEQFFSYYCYLKKPSEVPIDHKILFFQKELVPAWEVLIR